MIVRMGLPFRFFRADTFTLSPLVMVVTPLEKYTQMSIFQTLTSPPDTTGKRKPKGGFQGGEIYKLVKMEKQKLSSKNL